jgi:hypothetical protein
VVKAETELVTFSHGQTTAHLAASAEADAVAKFNLRRGLRLSAEARAKIEGSLSEKLGPEPDSAAVTATISASIGAAARVALAAQLDVNGLWAEFCAAAEARAQIRGEVSVTGQVLIDALVADDHLPDGALVPALALLEEVELHAGIYAEVYFALRARARMMVGGSVIPREGTDTGAGFTVAFDYGYAYIWGAGISGYLDVDLPDAQHVVTVVADAVIDEVVRLLPPATPQQVTSLLQLVVPLAASAAVAVGRALGAPQTEPTGNGPAGAGVADALLTEFRTHGLTLVLNAVLDAGMEQVTVLINQSLDSFGFTDAVRSAGQAAVADARGILDALDSVDSMPDALPHLAALCDRLATFAADAAASPGTEDLAGVADGLNVAAAGSAILQQLLGTDPMPWFPAATAQRIRTGLSKTGPLTVADLVAYLAMDIGNLGESPLASVGWLADIAGAAAPDLIGLLWSLGEDPPDPAARTKLATDLVTGLIDHLSAHLRPFIDELPDGELKDVAVFIDPLLEVIEQALVPALAVKDQTSSAEMRDVLDTLLTSMFGAIVVRCLNAVVRPFFDKAETQLTDLADHVDRNDPALSDFFKAANQADVVFRISPAIVSESLRQVAAMLDLAEHSAFESAVELMTAFVLLPEEAPERRAQLAKLAGKDEARISDGQLTTDLIDALFVKSSQFAIGMIPPSILMSSIIAADQGPLPLATLYTEARQVAISTGKAINDLGALGATIDGVIGSLLEDGKVTAEELRDLGLALKNLIGSSAELVKDVIALIKDFTWPVFLTSTGGLVAIPLVRAQFDAFFVGAAGLVDEVKVRLDQLSDALIEAMIVVAADVGVLDTGDGDDLGTLGEAVRQRILGGPDEQPIELLEGKVRLEHGELATMTANAAFGNSAVRTKIRAFHEKALHQATNARAAGAVLMPDVQAADAAKAAAEARLAAQQRDTGFVFTISIEGIEQQSKAPSVARFHVAITGAGPAFVDGEHPLVRVEVGGWPAVIDPAGWRVGADGVLRGWFTVVADPTLLAPHPLVSQGAVAMPAQPSAVAGPLTGRHSLNAVHGVLGSFGGGGTPDPARFLARPPDGGQPAAALSADMFTPPILGAGGPGRAKRFPGVVALDRQELLAATTDHNEVATLTGFPGTARHAFVATTNASAVTLASTLAGRVTGGAPAAGPVSIVACARPGFTTITAAVHAVPKPGQDKTSAPAKDAEPVWFVLGGEPDEVPTPVDAATFKEEGAVAVGLPAGVSQVVTVVMHNSGDTTWTAAAGYKLGSLEPLGATLIGLPHDVPPRSDVWFPITIVAPPLAGTTFGWQMVKDGVDRQWFGEKSPAHRIGLIAGGFAGQTGVPATIPRGDQIAVTVSMLNTGSTPWTKEGGYRLGARGNNFGTPWHDLKGPVAPGARAEFTFNVGAPPTAVSFQWQMAMGIQWFGALSTLVNITPIEPRACAGLRATIASLDVTLAGLQTELNAASPQEKPAILKQIQTANKERAAAVSQAQTLGCHL